MDDGPFLAVMLLAAGVGAGVINTMAGAGALLLLPALMAAGLTTHEANGSMRAAIIAAGVAATITFARRKLPTQEAVLRVVPVTVVGAAAGALTATQLAASVLEPIMVATMLLVVLSAIRPVGPAAEQPQPRSRWVEMAGLLAAGFYGGMLQVGVGLVLLMVLVRVAGYGFVAANALKVVSTLAFNVAAFAVFAVAGDVNWKLAGWVAAGALAGGGVGARLAIRASDGWMRALVVIVGSFAVVALLLR